MALGGFLAGSGAVNAWAVFGVTWVANVGSAVAVYVAARTIGRRFFTGRIGRRILNPDALGRIEQLYQRYGVWGILLSRFIPGVRAVVPPFAGVAKLGAVRALLPVVVASGLWYGTLTMLSATLVREAGGLQRLVRGLNIGLAAVAIVVAAVVVLVVRSGRNRARS